jgi:uncharacterized membrane protein
MTDPTVPSPGPDSVNSALRRNIDALRERRRNELVNAAVQQRAAARITRFAGSMPFVYLHVAG